MSCSCCHNEKHETKNCETNEHIHHHHEAKQTSGCECGHCHHHEDETSKKTLVIKIALSGIFLVFAIALKHFVDLPLLANLAIFLVPYLIIGFSVIKEAIENIFHGDFFDENFLMTVATIGAFAIGEYPEAVLVMLLSQIGEMFETMASAKARKSISSMMDIKPDFAHLVIGESTKTINPEEVKIGDIILVKPGEKIPLDGIVEKGESSLDSSALTGESLPRTVSKDSEVVSGAINLSSLLYIRVTKNFSDSTVSKILDLVENAENKKAKAENFITKFAKFYTPIVVFAALALAIIPSLILDRKSLYFSCCFLSLCFSYFSSTKFFCRNRSCF